MHQEVLAGAVELYTDGLNETQFFRVRSLALRSLSAARVIKHMPIASWAAAITPNPTAMRVFFMVTAYILRQCSEPTRSRLTTGETPPCGQHHLCEEGANNDHKGGVERGFVAAIPREIRMMTTSRVYRNNSYPCDTAGVVPGGQRVFDTILGRI